MALLKLFIAMSVDGFIAKPDDDLTFLNIVEKAEEDYGHTAFLETVDTILIGRKTYDYVERAIGVSYYTDGQRTVYVATRTLKGSIGNLHFYSGDIVELVKKLKATNAKDIYCDGGGELIYTLLQHDLIDEMTISVIPILVGEGTRLFREGRPEQRLSLVSATPYDTGLVQLHYRRS